MIHTKYTMTLGRYGQLDDTGSLDLLRMWYNPFPVKWFNTDKFFDQYREVFGGKKESVQDDVYKLLAYNNILVLDQMIKTMSILMRNTNDRSLFGLLYKKTSKEYTGNFQFYVNEVKKITGIEVKDGKGLIALQKKTQFLLDKYNERYADTKQPKKTPSSFTDVVMGVFIYMGLNYDPKMTLFEFGNLKNRADKKAEPKA